MGAASLLESLIGSEETAFSSRSMVGLLLPLTDIKVVSKTY